MIRIRKFLSLRRLVYFCIPIIILSIFLISFPSKAVTVTGVDFIGRAVLPNGLIFQKTELGGLSGITYDAQNNLFYAISDDRGQKAPARFYTLKIDLSKGKLENGDVVPVGVTTLLNEKGQTFAAGSTDTEGIAATSRGMVFVSSEGDVKQLINPFIKEFALASGKEVSSLPIPERFLPSQDGKRGVRDNLAFESLTVTPDEKTLFTATENALVQDGSEAKPRVSTRCRILQYNLLTNQPEKEYLYLTESVKPLLRVRTFASGLPDLVAIDNEGNFLVIERAFTGLGFAVALYQVSLDGATEVQNIDSLATVDIKTVKPVKKKLLLDLRRLDVVIDNLEGLTVGPKLPNGQPSLILVSDNNFNNIQRTQILAFGLRIEQKSLFRTIREVLPFF